MNELVEKNLYLNKPQILIHLIGAKITICIWGRGTGKSEGVIAPWIIERVFSMPRSKGIIIGPHYQHILSNTLPQVLEMWERMGYYRNVHFMVGKKPPASWHWPEPYASPLSSKHTIYWFNGSCQVLVSQDRSFNSAGPSVDYIIGDEAKHLVFDKLQETFQTNRGNRQYFGHLSHHHSILFCTDMPTSPKSNWIFLYESQVDQEAIDIVMGIQHEILLLQSKLRTASAQGRKSDMEQEIRDLTNTLNYVRKGGDSESGLVYFSEVSTLENMEVVGENFIREQKRNLPDFKFRSSILNQRVKKSEGMFYPMLNEDLHYYFSFSYSRLDHLGFDFSKITTQAYHQDGDVRHKLALDIALDYNIKINTLVVGQEIDNRFKTLNFLFVLSPMMLKDVVAKFLDYYKDHLVKEVNYYFDFSAIAGNAMVGDYSFSDQVTDLLIAGGWEVNQFYTGAIPSYQLRYEMFNSALRGNSNLPMPSFNQHNCASLLISLESTLTRNGKTGFEIDKRSENDPNVLPNHATHAQEAWGVLYHGKYVEDWKSNEDSFDDALMM